MTCGHSEAMRAAGCAGCEGELRDRLDASEAEVARLTSHIEEQAEALGIEEGGPPEGTTTGRCILAIRDMHIEISRLREALEDVARCPTLSMAPAWQEIAREALGVSPPHGRTVMVGGYAPGNETPNNRAVYITHDTPTPQDEGDEK